MGGLSKLTSCKNYFKQYKLLTLPSILIYEAAIFVKTHPEVFTFNNQKYLTRQNINIHHNRYELSLSSKSPYNTLCMLYNKLPSAVKQTTNVHSLKTKLKTYLLEKTYYSLTEYLS